MEGYLQNFRDTTYRALDRSAPQPPPAVGRTLGASAADRSASLLLKHIRRPLDALVRCIIVNSQHRKYGAVPVPFATLRRADQTTLVPLALAVLAPVAQSRRVARPG